VTTRGRLAVTAEDTDGIDGEAREEAVADVVARGGARRGDGGTREADEAAAARTRWSRARTARTRRTRAWCVFQLFVVYDDVCDARGGFRRRWSSTGNRRERAVDSRIYRPRRGGAPIHGQVEFRRAEVSVLGTSRKPGAV